MCAKQIAFLFLTRGEHHNPSLWEQYFLNADPSLYSIYIHPKDPKSLHSPLWKSKQSTVLRPIPTDWGTLSLVKATLYLLQVALKNNFNQKFILVSESCIPIQSFQSLYDFIMKDNQSYIHWNYGSNLDRQKIHNKFSSIQISPNVWAKMSQWFCLDRSHVQLLLDSDYMHRTTHYLSSYYYVPVPDEHFFIHYLLYVAKIDIRTITNKALTYVNWETKQPHPKVFHTIDLSFIEECRKKEMFFMRKVAPLSIDLMIAKELLQNPFLEWVQMPIDTTEEDKKELIRKILKKINKDSLTTMSIDELKYIESLLFSNQSIENL